jgi:hypothetical protein
VETQDDIYFQTKEAFDHSGWIKPMLVLPITSQIVIGMQVLLTTWVGSLIN